MCSHFCSYGIKVLSLKLVKKSINYAEIIFIIRIRLNLIYITKAQCSPFSSIKNTASSTLLHKNLKLFLLLKTDL
jgi:hypothetical protein